MAASGEEPGALPDDDPLTPAQAGARTAHVAMRRSGSRLAREAGIGGCPAGRSRGPTGGRTSSCVVFDNRDKVQRVLKESALPRRFVSPISATWFSHIVNATGLVTGQPRGGTRSTPTGDDTEAPPMAGPFAFRTGRQASA